MAKMLRLQEEIYTALANWLKTDLPSLPNNERVWKAFRDFTNPDKAGVLDAVRFGPLPMLFVEDLGGVKGLFNPGKPKTISVGKRLVESFQQQPNDAQIRQSVEATILHEMVHWSWGDSENEKDASGALTEKGYDFEDAAYGPPAAGVRRERLFVPEDLGSLSRRFESNGKPGAIGRDTNGGWSYGLYQISSRQGTMRAFLDFLRRQSDYATFGARLEAAGGDAAARSGTLAFHEAWKSLAEDVAFRNAQHRFIKETHYDKYVANLLSKGIDVRNRSKALRDVAWSVSVQHGAGRTEIFTRAWDTLSPEERSSDAQLINAIYHERSRVHVYFASSNANERAAVLRRFQTERADALAMLQMA